jgi:hypothetical protein
MDNLCPRFSVYNFKIDVLRIKIFYAVQFP